MLDAIEQNLELHGISRRTCAENTVEVAICSALLAGDDLDDSSIKILKVDDYYNTKNFAMPPKSVDCLVVVRCASGSFELTLVELRDVSSTKGVKPSEIIRKFEATFLKFMSEDFGAIFGSPADTISRIRAWLVTDPFRASGLSDEQYRCKIKGTVLDFYQSARRSRFGSTR
jgi:hypothetical protein